MIKKITPINEAEAIIEPFWDPVNSGIREWKVNVSPQEAESVVYRNKNSVTHDHYDWDSFYSAGYSGSCGLFIHQYWAMVNFGWSGSDLVAPVLDMSRDFHLELSDYDTLILSLAAPQSSRVIVSAETDKGVLQIMEESFPSCRKELELDLQGASRLESLNIKIFSADDEPASGWFNWIGLRKSSLLPGYLKRWQFTDISWNGYLKSPSESISFTPVHNLYVGKDEIIQLQREYEISSIKENGHGSAVMGLVQAGEVHKEIEPENFIGEYVNFWTDRRFNRERDENRPLIGPGPEIALAGLITKDPALLRLAARYALSLVTCENWKDSFICNFPGSSWEHKAFVLSLVQYDIALIMDMAGELFTPAGKNLILRRLAEETGFMNYNVFKYGQPEEDIFEMNQLAWFSPGRLASLILMEQYWPRVKEYTDSAYRDLIESLERTILDDGGYPEGPNYFSVVAKAVGLALPLFANARHKDIKDVIPSEVLKTGRLCEAFSSTISDNDMIPVSDSRTLLSHDVLSSMAFLMPRSSWGKAYEKELSRNHNLPMTLDGWRYTNIKIPQESPIDPSETEDFLFLEKMGVFASTRQLGGEIIKILIPGGAAGVGHNHEDKGSFIIEFAGEIFAADPGIGPYDEALSGLMKGCRYHNMLIPTGNNSHLSPSNPLTADIMPRVERFSRGFKADLDLTDSWTSAYTRWERTFKSESPDELFIKDTYKLQTGESVQFLWITPLPVELKEGQITIKGTKGVCRLTLPELCLARVEKMKMPGDTYYHRIVITRQGISGVMEFKAQFVLTE